LLAAIQVALGAAESTDGLVDPTIGRSVRAIGYDRDFEVIVRLGGSPEFELIPAVGWRSVRVDSATATVTLASGSELDLGATAKAFAADRIAEAINSLTGSSVMVSLGGDIAVAGTGPEGGWPILVTDDSRAKSASGQVVGVHAGGLATSSTTVRRWHAGATALHHIVDPRTGAPAAVCWRTASVAASSCLEANIAATAAIVLGPQAPRWLAARQLSARLVNSDGLIQTTGGWPTVPARPENAMQSASTSEVLDL
jgi:thiamine biosynthesis lipoprotein